MKRTIGLVFALVLVVAAPAWAHVGLGPIEKGEPLKTRVVQTYESDDEDEGTEVEAADEDSDSSDPLAFAALLFPSFSCQESGYVRAGNESNLGSEVD